MAYVACRDCENMVHFKPQDVELFHQKYVVEKEPIYCLHCYKKREKAKGVDSVDQRRNKGLFNS